LPIKSDSYYRRKFFEAQTTGGGAESQEYKRAVDRVMRLFGEALENNATVLGKSIAPATLADWAGKTVGRVNAEAMSRLVFGDNLIELLSDFTRPTIPLRYGEAIEESINDLTLHLFQAALESAHGEACYVENSSQEIVIDSRLSAAAAGSGLWNAETRETVLNLGQMAIDFAGIFEPTPSADLLNTVISLIRLEPVDAGISLVSAVPYLGDCAKLAKIPKWINTITTATALVANRAELAKYAEPILTAVRNGTESLARLVPESLAVQVGQLRQVAANGVEASGKAIREQAAKTIAWITPGSLSVEEETAVLETLWHIDNGTLPGSTIGTKWGIPFENREGFLPGEIGASSPYREFRVAPPSGTNRAGERRIVVNVETNEMYYTWTHYGDTGSPSFLRVR
jgi:guanyl-specific ribonuclease Sa